MQNFWESSVWGFFNIFALILVSLLVANALKQAIKPLKNSLIPTSVLGGILLFIIATIYKSVTDEVLFDVDFFAGTGSAYLEMITYHALALGFIASSLKSSKRKLTRKRMTSILNTGVTTVSTYLLQGSIGLAVTIIAGLFVSGIFEASGILLAFGYGQGTGQAMNYGLIYENQGFVGGKSFGLTVAAIGFLCASIGGVIHLNILRHTGKLKVTEKHEETITMEDVQAANDIPMQESVDKLSIQLALITLSYMGAFLLMYFIGNALEGMKSLIYGFNFLLGVISATVVKLTLRVLKKMNIVKKDYTNNFLLTRTSNFFFDIMVVAGIAAIRLDLIEDYIGVLIILCAIGMIVTYVYNRIVAKVLFKNYPEEQFLGMYGMLTGTASTGIILLREIDGDFKTPVANNMVYQNFPAIILGFPMMFLANFCPKNPVLTMIILIAMFVALNILLFRRQIFGKIVKFEDDGGDPKFEQDEMAEVAENAN